MDGFQLFYRAEWFARFGVHDNLGLGDLWLQLVETYVYLDFVVVIENLILSFVHGFFTFSTLFRIYLFWYLLYAIDALYYQSSYSVRCFPFSFLLSIFSCQKLCIYLLFAELSPPS
jgi:hypothetical protein